MEILICPQVWCAKHEHLRHRHPEDSGIINLALFRRAISSPDFQAQLAESQDPSVNALNTAIANVGPLCCYLGEQAINEVCLHCATPETTEVQ